MGKFLPGSISLRICIRNWSSDELDMHDDPPPTAITSAESKQPVQIKDCDVIVTLLLKHN